jgi:hypothetical protein
MEDVMLKTRIYGLGLSRTGTTTLAELFKGRGLRFHHYPKNVEQMYHPKTDGANDLPVIPEYKRLDKRFPTSKYIYTVRELDAWIDSMEYYIGRKKDWVQSQAQLGLRREIYGSADFNKQKYLDGYRKHEEDVLQYFKNRPNDLLVLDIIGGDTPQKLYDFLGYKDPAPESFKNLNQLKRT